MADLSSYQQKRITDHRDEIERLTAKVASLAEEIRRLTNVNIGHVEQLGEQMDEIDALRAAAVNRNAKWAKEIAREEIAQLTTELEGVKAALAVSLLRDVDDELAHEKFSRVYWHVEVLRLREVCTDRLALVQKLLAEIGRLKEGTE